MEIEGQNSISQTSSTSSTKRIAKNTLMLYFRQILIMLVSLYTVRVILATLGAEDYGVYNVVAGVVTMFGFLSSSMAGASQRFFSVEIGKGNAERLRDTFKVTLLIYILLAIFILLALETVGLWFVINKLVIPDGRLGVTKIIYQYSLVGFVFGIIQSPFMAAIIAHEDMSVYAYVSIVEACLKLAIVFLLRLIPFDKLSLYGFLTLCVAIINASLYIGYCLKKYKETKFGFLWNKEIFKEILSYTGWNLLGTISAIARNQGINVILNLFFGPIVNAARGIAYQVNTALNSFSHNFSTAFRPQIVKTYARNERDECMSLVYRGSKFCYFLMLFLSLPVLLEAPFLLGVWLKNVPEHAVIFTRLVIIDTLIETISYGLIALTSAQGRLKEYQLVVSGITLLNLPIAYVFLKLGFLPESTMIIAIFISMAALIARIFMLRWLASLSIRKYFRKALLPIVGVTVCSVILPFIVSLKLEQDFIGFISTGIASVLSVGVFILLLGMTNNERRFVLEKSKGMIKRGSK